MRYSITILLAFLMIGCANDNSKKESSTDTIPSNNTESLAPQVITNPTADQPGVLPTDQPPTPNPDQVNVAADADGKVWHFACADKCEGGVGDQKGPCPVCGKEMGHNQAYHSNTNNTPTPTPVDPTANPGVPQINPQPPIAEPAQNANGVWHYTCPSGCVGGGGAAGPCAICGTTLAHNTAYHQ